MTEGNKLLDTCKKVSALSDKKKNSEYNDWKSNFFYSYTE